MAQDPNYVVNKDIGIDRLPLTLERTNALRKLMRENLILDVFDFIEDAGITLSVFSDYLNCNLNNRDYIEAEHIHAMATGFGMTAKGLYDILLKCAR